MLYAGGAAPVGGPLYDQTLGKKYTTKPYLPYYIGGDMKDGSLLVWVLVALHLACWVMALAVDIMIRNDLDPDAGDGVDAATDKVLADLWLVGMIAVGIGFGVIVLNLIMYLVFMFCFPDKLPEGKVEEDKMDPPLTDSAYAIIKASTSVTVVFSTVMLLLTVSPQLSAGLVKSGEEGFAKSLRIKLFLSLMAKIFVYSCFTALHEEKTRAKSA